MGNKDEKNAIREWIETIKYKKRMTQQDIAKELGVSKTYLSDVITGRSPYSDKLKQRLSELYSDCIVDSPVMYGGNVEQANVMGDNIKNATDTGMQSELSKLVELLASKELSLQKAQEHIDRLLAIIDNLTKQG